MDHAWYFRHGDQTVGPVAVDELAAMAADGRLQKDTWVCCGESGDWTSAADVDEIAFPQDDEAAAPIVITAGNGLAAAARVSSAASSQQPLPQDEDDVFLDGLEDLLTRMTKGIFVFPFVKVPRWLWSISIRLFPKLVKALRVLLWIGIWCLTGFGPVIYLFVHRGYPPGEAFFDFDGQSRTVRTVFLVITAAWTLLAGVMGSIYGVNYLKSRRRRAAMQAQASRIRT